MRSERVLLCAPDRAERSLIAAALRDASVVAWDPSLYPVGAAPPSGAFDAIWLNFGVGAALPAMEPGVRETCIAAAEAQVIGWLEGLSAFAIDPHWTKQRADNKPYQLGVARAVGLDVPANLISNDAAAVRAFADVHGAIVAKMLVQPPEDVVFTTVLGEDELASLDGLDLCPMIFQAQVPNAGDVRATVIGRRVVAAIHESPGVDWRRESYARDEAPVWLPYSLPAQEEARLLALASRLGLEYGAADFVRRPDGSLAFLELNASGSFAFLGADLAASIASAVASVLLDPEARRCSR